MKKQKKMNLHQTNYEVLKNKSNQPQHRNLNQKSKQIIEMTIEKKKEIQLLYKDGFMSKGENNSLIRRCNEILNQTDNESVLDVGRKHMGHLSINYDLLYRNPNELEKLKILFFGSDEEKLTILNKQRLNN